jgi:hypothetical protein
MGAAMRMDLAHSGQQGQEAQLPALLIHHRETAATATIPHPHQGAAEAGEN